MYRFSLAVIFLSIITFSLAAQQPSLDLPSRQIEDDSSLRISLRDLWFTEVPGRVLNRRAEYHTLKGGSRIQVRSEAGRDEFLVILARELREPRLLRMPSASSSSVNQNNFFPGWAQGSWILSRRTSDGTPTRIRVFLRSDPYTYIQFRPFTIDKCQMDVVLYEGYAIRSLPLAIPFERLLVLPLEEVLSAAENRFPRRYFDPQPNMYRDIRAFTAAVRSRLPALSFVDDGAIDENGDYVFIDTLEYQIPPSPEPVDGQIRGGLNCSGFAKWIVDGILKPFTGERLAIAPLKEAFGSRGSSFTEPWERLRDPFFGLDWCRNLVSRAGTILRSPAYAPVEEFEVRSSSFSELIERQNGNVFINPYTGFLPEAGFGIEGLQPLLYTLAVDEPGRIYLAAVNNETGSSITPENPRGLPKLRQYFHVAVLVPYFNEYGNFQVTVFESAAETSFASFRNRYPGNYVNLMRIPIDGSFDPD